ncbi:hypothetical protein SRHO_G00273330 [Serrasalmus rhombeus]
MRLLDVHVQSYLLGTSRNHSRYKAAGVNTRSSIFKNPGDKRKGQNNNNNLQRRTGPENMNKGQEKLERRENPGSRNRAQSCLDFAATQIKTETADTNRANKDQMKQ